jgi:hypothetical protein
MGGVEILLLVLPLLNFRNLIEATLPPHERDAQIGCIVFFDSLIVRDYKPHVVADVPDSMVNQHARSFKFQ